jgi:uncharacterized protein (DUF983 family)
MSESSSKVTCIKCGAQQKYDPAQRVIKCDFCGSETEIHRREDVLAPIEQSDFIVPLVVDKRALESATHAYMVLGEFTPDDILEQSVITKQWLNYIPTYLFRGNYEASWTASFGYDKTEHYTEYVTRYRNNHSYQEPVTRTKVITDWRPVNGTDSGSFCVQVYAGTKLDARAATLVENASLTNKITAFKQDYLIGFDVEPYSVREQDAYRDSGEAGINSVIDYGVKSHAQGDHQRDWHWTANIDKSTDKVLMPLAHSVFEYQGKEYHVWIDGSDSTKVVGDDLPVDKNRKNATYFGMVPFGVTCSAIAISVFVRYPFSFWFAVAAVGVTGLYAYLRKKQIINYSKSVRNALLIQKQATASDTVHMPDEQKSKLASSYQKPKMPVLADASKDKFVLPALTSIALLCVFLPGVFLAQEEAVPDGPVVAQVPPASPTPPAEPPAGDQPPAAVPPQDPPHDPPSADQTPKAPEQGAQQSPKSNVGWASVYYSDATHKYNWSIGHKTPESAQSKAQANCDKNYGSCKEWATKQKKCFAIYANREKHKMTLAFGDSLPEAKSNAEANCVKYNGPPCELDATIGAENAAACDQWSE